MKEVVILMGMQGSGKPTFFKQRFVDTHLRINLDMLMTRRREQRLVEACLAAGQSFVVDNTNPTRYDRSRYIGPAKAAGFQVVGYYFDSDFEACRRRNEQRPADQVVPIGGLHATHARLEPPCRDEGFDKLFAVRVGAGGGFVIRPLRRSRKRPKD